jgi:hypothetical protein
MGFDVLTAEDVFELPRHYTRYLRNYALHRAFKRRGPGQDLKLSAWFESRFKEGFGRIARRMTSIDEMRTYVLGGDAPDPRHADKEMAGVPWNFVRSRGGRY